MAIFSSQLCQHEEEEKHLEEQLSMKASEYDNLYIEHDEEVRALQQQKEQVMYQLEDMEERFQHLLSAHEKQVKKEQLTQFSTLVIFYKSFGEIHVCICYMYQHCHTRY